VKVYRTQVWDRIDSRGVQLFSDRAEVVEINGAEFVSFGHHMVRRDNSWHESEEQAAEAAAQKIEEYAGLLLRQARMLRKQEPAHASA
jgi:Icc-related predicted phosphoesterase